MSVKKDLERLERVAIQRAIQSKAGQAVIGGLNSKPVYQSRVTIKSMNNKKNAFWYLASVASIVGVQIGVTDSFNPYFALGVTAVAFIAYIAQGD